MFILIRINFSSYLVSSSLPLNPEHVQPLWILIVINDSGGSKELLLFCGSVKGRHLYKPVSLGVLVLCGDVAIKNQSSRKNKIQKILDPVSQKLSNPGKTYIPLRTKVKLCANSVVFGVGLAAAGAGVAAGFLPPACAVTAVTATAAKIHNFQNIFRCNDFPDSPR